MAVSDPTGTIARPLPPISRVGSPSGRRRLDMIVGAEAPDLIVVGEPRLLSGDAGSQAQVVHRFADELCERVGIPVEFVDERLSTVEAERRASVSGSTASVDSLAACVLLEAFLAAR